MKKSNRFSAVVMILVFLSVVFYSVQAGVEPSPFKTGLQKLRLVLVRVTVVQTHLEQVQGKLLNPRAPNSRGLESRLAAVENTMDNIHGIVERVCRMETGDVSRETVEAIAGPVLTGLGAIITETDYISRLCHEYAPELLPALNEIQGQASSMQNLISDLLAGLR